MIVAPLRCPCCSGRNCHAEECEQALLDQLAPPREGDLIGGRVHPDRPAWSARRRTGCTPTCIACARRRVLSRPLQAEPPTQREVLAYLHQRRRWGKRQLAAIYGVAERTIYSWLGRTI